MKKKSIRNVLLFLFVIFLFYHLVSYCGYGNIIEGAFIRPSQSVDLRALKLSPGMKYYWGGDDDQNWYVSGFNSNPYAENINTYLCPYEKKNYTGPPVDSTWLNSPDKVDNMSGFRYCKDPSKNPTSNEPAFTCPTGYFCYNDEGCTKCEDCSRCLSKATQDVLDNMKNNVGIDSIEFKLDDFASGTFLYNLEIVIKANQTGSYQFQFINEDKEYEYSYLTVNETDILVNTHDVDFYSPYMYVTNVKWERSLTGNPIESVAAGTVETGKEIGKLAVATGHGLGKAAEETGHGIKSGWNAAKSEFDELLK